MGQLGAAPATSVSALRFTDKACIPSIPVRVSARNFHFEIVQTKVGFYWNQNGTWKMTVSLLCVWSGMDLGSRLKRKQCSPTNISKFSCCLDTKCSYGYPEFCFALWISVANQSKGRAMPRTAEGFHISAAPDITKYRPLGSQFCMPWTSLSLCRPCLMDPWFPMCALDVLQFSIFIQYFCIPEECCGKWYVLATMP